MKRYASAVIGISICLVQILVCEGQPRTRELQTIYSAGRYRTKNSRELGIAIQQVCGESPAARQAWEAVTARAEEARRTLPAIRSLAVDLERARDNNVTNIATARKAYDLALVFSVKQDRESFVRAAGYLRTFRNSFNPEQQLQGIVTNHNYHVLYARDWLPYLAYTYDILYNHLQERERQENEEWFRRMVRVIEADGTWERWKNTTHGTWQAAALGIVGSALEDAGMKAIAERRIRYQLDYAFSREGFWKGGALSLHFTAARGVLAYAGAVLSGGNNPFQWKNSDGTYYLKQIVSAPLKLLDPFGEIPGIDHMATERLPGDIYMQTYQHYRNPLFAAVYESNISELEEEAVIEQYMKPDKTVVLEALPPYSVISPTLGLAILRTVARNPAQTLYARMDYGPHGGSGGHADKLALYLCGNGRRVTSDDDSYAAGSELRKGWIKHTVAHNTVVINYRSQSGARTPSDSHGATGKLLLFDRTPLISVAEAEAAGAYPDASLQTYRRCIALSDKYCLDIFTISSLTPITADWVFHGTGKKFLIKDAMPGERALGNEQVEEGILGSGAEGYNWIDEVTTYSANEQWSIIFSSGLRTIMMGQAGTRLMTGRSGGSAEKIGEIVTQRSYDRTTLIVRRTNVLDTQFVAVHEIIKTQEPEIESFARLDTGTDALVLEIMTKEYKDIFILQPKMAVKEMMVDEKHMVTLEPRRYGFLRINRADNSVVDEVNLSVKTYN